MTLPAYSERERSGGHVVLLLTLPPDTAAFAGHFPGRPVLPGVVQLDWAMQFAARYFVDVPPSAQDFQVKFRSLILPGAVTLTLKQDADARRLSFTYADGKTIFSTGTVRMGNGS